MGDENTEQPGVFEDRLRRVRGRSSRNAVASAKVTREEQQELERAAKQSGKALSEWAREVLLKEARRGAGDPVMTELIANRLLMMNLLKPLLLGQKVSAERIRDIVDMTRAEKHKAAKEVLRQYGPALPEKGLAERNGAAQL